MELVEYQECFQSDRWIPANYITNGFIVLNTLFLGYFIVKCYIRLRQVRAAFDWENTLITSKLHNALADVREIKARQDRRDHILNQVLLDIDRMDLQLLSLKARKDSASITDTDIKKMHWAIQMLVFTLHYGMPFEPHKTCLEEYMNKEGHSVRTYAEKYIYPEVFTTPEQMYDFGLEYLYGTGRAWEKDVTIARKWFAAAALKGHYGAKTQLRLIQS
jgi:hypothetical protein